ncbi:MAG TPA: hypothetical protein VMU64_11120 [Acidimicrobiales bacterium]|nr:hypothetical protein [Acidimicrobiales bacterium]
MINAATRRPTIVAALAALVAVSALLVAAGPGPAGASISWSAVTPPLPADAVAGQGLTLASTSCPADGWCVAVGDYLAVNGSNYYAAGLIVSESGSTWTSAKALLPSDAALDDPQALLQAVTCSSVGTCVAVGRYLDTSGATQGLIEQLSDGVWSPTEIALPGDADASGSVAYAQLSAVSCPTSTWCTAVGLYSPNSGGEQALVATDVGGNWSAVAAPLPASASGSQFLGLACPAAGSCVATGTYLVGADHLGLIETLSSGTWTGTTLPVPSGTSPMASIVNNDLSVSCATVSSCVIAGTTFDGNYEGLLDTLAAGAWTAAAVPLPGGQPSTDVQLTSVACTDASSCVATGLVVESGVEQGLFESLASGTWTPSVAATPPGTPAGANIEIDDVVCPAAGTCVADGQSNVTGSQTGLFWNLSAGSWVVSPTPLPGDAASSPDPLFAPIACPAAGVCLAVGTYLGSGGREGVIETDPSLAASTTTASVTAMSNQAISYAATVVGSAQPTGTVIFSAGLSALCTATIVNGTATCTGPIPPTRVVLASYSGDGASAPSFGVTTSPDIPTTISLVWGYWQTAVVNSWFRYPLSVKVTDRAGAGVPGVAVTFAVPTKGASAVLWGPNTSITNAQGIATSPALSANAKVNSYDAVATASGVAGSSSFWLSNVRG